MRSIDPFRFLTCLSSVFLLTVSIKNGFCSNVEAECNATRTQTSASSISFTVTYSSHEYVEESDVTKFFYKSSRVLNNDEYWAMGVDNCNYIATNASGSYNISSNNLDRNICWKSRQMSPKSPGEPIYELVVKGNVSATNTAFFLVNSKNYTISAIKGPNCWCTGGGGVLCNPLEKIACFETNKTEPKSCSTFGINNKGIYPLVGCQATQTLTLKEPYKYACAYANSCRKLGMTTDLPGHFTYCCETPNCNVKMSSRSLTPNSIIVLSVLLSSVVSNRV